MSDAAYWKDITEECSRIGLCVRCRKELAEYGKSKCGKCLQYQADYMRSRRKDNIKAGLCRCGRAKDDESLSECVCCADKRTINKRKVAFFGVTV